MMSMTDLPGRSTAVASHLPGRSAAVSFHPRRSAAVPFSLALAGRWEANTSETIASMVMMDRYMRVSEAAWSDSGR